MAVTLQINTKVDTNEAVKSTKQLENEFDDLDKSVNNVTASLDKMTGGAITTFKSIVSGAKSGVKAMFTLKGAIAATGIGALVIAVGSLISYFKNTQEGADKLNQAFEVVGATVDVLIDRFSKIGEALTLLFTKPAKAAALFKEAVSGIGSEILRESEAALELERSYQALEKRRIDFIVTEKRLTAEINAARLASEDFNLTVEARSAANQRAIELERQLAKERTEQAAEALRIQRERNALGESLNEDIEKERNLEAELFQIESDRDTRLKELIAKQRTLNDEMAKGRDIRFEETLAPIESLTPTNELTPENQARLTQEELLLQKLKQANENHQVEITDINIRESAQRADREEAIAKANANARLAIEQNVFAAAGLLADENLKSQKYIAAAQATFNTYQAVSAALAQTTDPTPTQSLRFGNAIAAGVFGLLQVRKILSTTTGGGSSPSIGAASGTQIGGGATQSEPDQARLPSFDSFNRGVGGTQNASFNAKAYVVEQDIKDSRQLSERIDDLATV